MASTEAIHHRGLTVSQHGRRWRFKWKGAWQSFQSLPSALERLDQLIDRQERERYVAGVEGSTIRQLVNEWWSRKRRELRESSQIRYEGVMRLHIIPRIGHLSADHIRPLDIEDFYAHVTYKTALVSRDLLRPALRWGMANDLVRRTDGSNPFDIAVLRRSRCLDGDAETDVGRTSQVDERLIPTTADIETLLIDAEEQEDWRWWLYLRLAPSLGARPGELCALQGKDLDPVEHAVSITKSASHTTFKITAPKRAASIRTLHVGPKLFEDIGLVIDDIAPEDFLFPATGLRNGERRLPCWHAGGVRGRLARASKRTGTQRYTPHSLRHYCATHLLDRGWPSMQVARWLGHRNDTMVRLLYAAHIVEDTRLSLGEAAGRLVSRPAPRAQR